MSTIGHISPPLAEIPARSASSSTAMRRIVAAIVAAGCIGVLGLAAYLTPSPTGLGTHQVMNLPPCGWIAVADLPCPTCGMTTAFAHAANGNLLASFLAQPLGCLLALAMAMTLLASLHIVITGSRLHVVFMRLWGKTAAWSLAFLVIAAWGYKVLSYKGWL